MAAHLPRGCHQRVVLACGTVRYWLDNGWFLDGARFKAHYGMGCRYSLWEPGASRGGARPSAAGGTRWRRCWRSTRS